MEAHESLKAYRGIGIIFSLVGAFGLFAGYLTEEGRLAIGGGLLVAIAVVLLLMSLDNRLGKFVRLTMRWIP